MESTTNTLYAIPTLYSQRERYITTLQWRHNVHDGVSNHQPHECLRKRLFRRRSKKTLKLRVTFLCEWNSPVTSEFPTQRASNAENIYIWWRHHGLCIHVILHTDGYITQTFTSHFIYTWRNNQQALPFLLLNQITTTHNKQHHIQTGNHVIKKWIVLLSAKFRTAWYYLVYRTRVDGEHEALNGLRTT